MIDSNRALAAEQPLAVSNRQVAVRDRAAWSRADLLSLAVLAALIALFFWRILTPNPADRAQFPPGDFTSQFYAFRLYESRSFVEGRLPFWSENLNSGHPFWADVQSAVLYPVGLANVLLNLALFGSFSLVALELEALFHFWLAGCFTYLFARRTIGGRWPSFAAAVVFAFGGYLTSYPPLQLAILETATWLPLALYFLDRLATEPAARPRWAVAAGLVLGIAALAGHPQTFVFVAAACAVYFAFRVWSESRPSPDRASAPSPRRAALWFFGVVVIALGLAAGQLLPSLEYTRLSTRQALSFREAAAGLPTLDLLQFILPGFTSAFASPLYVGVLPLWLALLALLRRDRQRWFWALLALGALVLAFGFYVFAYAALYALVPGLGLFRQQERLAFLVSFALALLSGYGLQDLLGGPNARGGRAEAVRAARRLWPLLAAGLVIALVLLLTFYAAGVQTPSGRLAFLGDRAGLMLLLFALAALLVAAYLRARLSAPAFAALALAFILFDLFSVNEPANKGAAADPFPPNPLIQTVQADPQLFRVADQGELPGHFGIAYNLEEAGGISPLRLDTYAALLTLPRDKLWPLLNLKYVFSSQAALPGAELAAQSAGLNLFRLNPLPRAFLVGAVVVEPDDGRALKQLATALDPRRTAILSAAPPFPPQPQAAAGTLTVTRHEPEHISLAVDAPADGLVVLSENDYPGWQATVDRAPAEILRADVSLRAVPVRAGRHSIEMTFDPPSVRLGLGLSLLTLLLSLAALGIMLLRQGHLQDARN